MTSRDRVVTLPPGAKTRDSHKAVLGHLKDKDETHQPLPFPGSAHGLHDQGGSRDAFDAQSASLAPGTQTPWFGRDPLRAGAKRPAAAYFPCADPEFLESIGEPVAAGSQAESTVRSTWQAQAAPVLAGRAATIPVERAAHPSTATDHAPPSAAGASRAGSNAAASKVEKKSVPGPRGSGGVASTHDAPGGADGSRSRATMPAVAFQHVQLGTVINAGYFYLLHNLSGNSSEVGRDTCDALTQGAPRTTDAACDLLFAASLAMRLEWHDALVLPAIGHNHTASRPGSTLHRLASAVARGCGGTLRWDLLSHTPRASARATPPHDRLELLRDAYTFAELPLGCSRVVLVDDCFDTCATATSMASALMAAAARAGIKLTIALVCVARCVQYTRRAANAHLPVAVREQLVAALDEDDAASGSGAMEEGEVGGAIYRVLNYVGSTARAKYGADWTGERMVAARAAGHHHLLGKGNHHSPIHQEQAQAYHAIHGEWPPFRVLEVLRTGRGETTKAFHRRVIRAEQAAIDALGDARSNASPTAGRPRDEDCAKGALCGGENDYRVLKAEKDLKAAEQADASAGEVARRAPQDQQLQAAAAAAAAALELAQVAHQTALQQQAHTRDGKAKGGECGTEKDHRVHKAKKDLAAAEQADASAREAARRAPQDQQLQAAAAAAAALELAQVAHQTAKQ